MYMSAVRAWLPSLLTLFAACADDPQPSHVFALELVAPSGDNPLVGASSVRLRVQQGDEELVEREVPVRDARIGADVPLASLITPVRIGVEVVGAGTLQIGAPPPFVPVEAAGTVVRIPVGVPDSCVRVDGMELETGRFGVALSRHGTFVLTAGGAAATGSSPDMGFLDLLELDAGAFDPLDVGLGPSRAAPFSSSRAVVLASDAAPLRYDVGSSDMPVLAGDLHDGAGYESAAVDLGAMGAAVLGGLDAAGAPVGDITFIAPDGVARRSVLATPRANGAAVALAGAILVVGGASAGTDPWGELVPIGGDGAALSIPSEDRRGGVLVPASDGERALLVGGTDSTGAPIEETVLFSCSATSCETAEGPRFVRARTAVAVVVLPTGGALLAGGDGPVASVDRVSFDEATAFIEPIGDLETPRAHATGFGIEPGLAFIVGGTTPDGPLASVELCFPRSLAFP